MRGGPGGNQRVAGSSFPNAALYSLYFSSAQGLYGTWPPPTIPPGRPTSKPAGVPMACHTPDISGVPSAVRGRASGAADSRWLPGVPSWANRREVIPTQVRKVSIALAHECDLLPIDLIRTQIMSFMF